MKRRGAREWAGLLLATETEARREEKSAAFEERMFAIHLRGMIILFVALAIVWPVPLNPLKLIVVLFHELSHVAAAYVTGGMVMGLAVDATGDGATLGIGGNWTIILAAGYGGCFLAGTALFFLASFDQVQGAIILLMGFLGSVLSLGWVDDFAAFATVVAIFFLTLGLLMGRTEVMEQVLRCIASAACLYPLLGILIETFGGGASSISINDIEGGSDLALFAGAIGRPVWVTGLLWLTVGAAMFMAVVRKIASRDAAEDRRIRHDTQIQDYSEAGVVTLSYKRM